MKRKTSLIKRLALALIAALLAFTLTACGGRNAARRCTALEGRISSARTEEGRAVPVGKKRCAAR